MKPLSLQGNMRQEDKSNLQSAIDSLNGAPVGRLQLTDRPDDLAFRTNIQNVYNSINSGYKKKIQLSGCVKDLTLRTNLTNIINRHNSKVVSEGSNNG